MHAPARVGIWNRQGLADSVHVYTCEAADRPANWHSYDHISVPIELETRLIAGHMHVTTRGFNAGYEFFPRKNIEGEEFVGQLKGERFVYKYDFNLAAEGAVLIDRPYKNLDRCVSLYNGEGARAKDLKTVKVKDFMFVQGSSAEGNWQVTFAKKNVQAVVRTFLARFFELQGFWVSMSGIDALDSVALDYEVRSLKGADVTAGKLNPDGLTWIERDWSMSEFRLKDHAPDWSPPLPGKNCMTHSGRYRYGFSLKKPVLAAK